MLDRDEREFLLRAEDDYSAPWELAKIVRRHHQEADRRQVKERSLEIVARLLADGLLEAGGLAAFGGFDRTAASTSETLAELDSEWSALGRDPDIGELMWFRITPRGLAVIQER